MYKNIWYTDATQVDQSVCLFWVFTLFVWEFWCSFENSWQFCISRFRGETYMKYIRIYMSISSKQFERWQENMALSCTVQVLGWFLLLCLVVSWWLKSWAVFGMSQRILVNNKMGCTDQLLLWNDGFMNATTTRIMRQRNEFQSDHPYLCIYGMLHARIIYFMWLSCYLFSVHAPCCIILSYWIICVILPSSYIYISLCIYSTTVLFVFFHPLPGSSSAKPSSSRVVERDRHGGRRWRGPVTWILLASQLRWVRLRETNITPEKMPFWKENHLRFWKIPTFQVLMWMFQGG